MPVREEAAMRQHGGQTRRDEVNAHFSAHYTPEGRRRQVPGEPMFTDIGEFAGTVFPDGFLLKAVVGSRHLLRMPPSIAYDVAALRRAKALGATGLVVLDKQTGTHHEALTRLCRAELRNPSDQMRHLLREALERRNALPAISDSREESKRDA
mgnify:CR=1 FL=1